MEMKLHLAGEDVALYLRDTASKALQRIPVAARELGRVRDEVSVLRSFVATTMTKLDGTAGEAKERLSDEQNCLNTLRDLDTVKGRMKKARDTLKEAAGLSTLFSLVEDLLSTEDVGRAAEALGGIRRGLSILSDSVEEFKDGRQKLERLEKRFAPVVEARLQAAFAEQKSEEASSLCAMLQSLGHADGKAIMEKTYVESRLPSLQILWDEYSPEIPFVSWISTFYDQLLHNLVAEQNWCDAAFATSLTPPTPALLQSLLIAFLSIIDKPWRARLVGALTGVSGSIMPLEHLEQAAAATSDFLSAFRQEIRREISDADPVLNLIVAPVEGGLQQYPEREQQYLSVEVSRIIPSKGLAVADAPGTLSVSSAGLLEATIDPLVTCIKESMHRCVRMTGGTAITAVTRVVDRALVQYVLALQSAITTAVQGDKELSPEVAVPLLGMLRTLTKRLTECGEALQSCARHVLTMLGEEGLNKRDENIHQSAPHLSTFPALLELRLRFQPELKQQTVEYCRLLLRSYTNAAGEGEGVKIRDGDAAAILPSSYAAFDELVHVLESIVERSLCSGVRRLLVHVPSLAEWKAQPITPVRLPNFTPYPLQYITAVGELVMMLPQLLESSLIPEQGDVTLESHQVSEDPGDLGDLGELVAGWVDRATLAMVGLYLEAIQRIQGPITSMGAAQLAADIEYFANIVSTVGVDIPPKLAAWQAALGASEPAGLKDVRARAAEDGATEEVLSAIDHVVKLREGFV
jgi:hypothetical protein